MATIGNLALNFNDLRKRQAPDGTIDHIIEVLKQSNPIMDDIKWKQGNLPTGNQTTQRTSIPTPSLRAINKGVQPTKSSTKQVRDTCCILEARSRVDIELLQLEPDPQAFRRSEDDAHIEGFSEKVASMIFYGDSDENLDEFNGFAKRYDHFGGKKGEYSYQVRDAGGKTDGALSSIWLIGWSNSVSGIYPKYGYAGLKMRDLGERTVEDAEGGSYQALESLFTWKPGLMVADPRMVAAVRNIDTAALLKATDAQKKSFMEQLIYAKNSLRRIQGENMKLGIYVSEKVYDFLESYLMDKNHVHVTRQDFANGTSVLALFGIPVYKEDALKDTESLITEA